MRLLSFLILLGCGSSQAVMPHDETETELIRNQERSHSAAHLYVAPGRGVRADPNADPATDFRVWCEDPSDCPEGIAMLVSPKTSADPPERCTATLVAKNIAITARHCIPESIRTAKQNCSDVKLLFPKTQNKQGSVERCQRILAQSTGEFHILNSEYLAMEISTTDRAPITVDNAPLEEGDIVEVVSVTPGQVYSQYHRVARQLCRVQNTERAVRLFGEGARRVRWLWGCSVMPGNSGAPVLDSAGNMRGLVHAGNAPIFTIGVMTPAKSFASTP